MCHVFVFLDYSVLSPCLWQALWQIGLCLVIFHIPSYSTAPRERYLWPSSLLGWRTTSSTQLSPFSIWTQNYWNFRGFTKNTKCSSSVTKKSLRWINKYIFIRLIRSNRYKLQRVTYLALSFAHRICKLFQLLVWKFTFK